MLRLILASLFTLAVTNMTPANSQDAVSDRRVVSHNYFELRRTRPGVAIAANFCDPFLSFELERKLLTELRRPYRFAWDSKTTLADVRRDLANLFPIEIDGLGLADKGLSPSETLKIPSSSVSQSPPDRDGLTRPGEYSDAVSLGAKLVHFLSQSGLTIALHNGQPVLTSHDRSFDHICVRLYDITPLDTLRMLSEDSDVSSLSGDLTQLTHLILSHVEPDSWPAESGPSAIMTYRSESRTLLAISTSLMNHLKIESLLNQLNVPRRP